MTRTALHVLNGIMTVLFAAAAVVQYNDPDPLLWIAIYGAAALCCALFLFGCLPRLLAVGLSGAYALGALYLLARVVGASGFLAPTGQEMIGVTEPGREMVGLLLTAGWTGVLALQQRPSRVAAGEEGGPRDSTVPE